MSEIYYLINRQNDKVRSVILAARTVQIKSCAAHCHTIAVTPSRATMSQHISTVFEMSQGCRARRPCALAVGGST